MNSIVHTGQLLPVPETERDCVVNAVSRMNFNAVGSDNSGNFEDSDYLRGKAAGLREAMRFLDEERTRLS